MHWLDSSRLLGDIFVTRKQMKEMFETNLVNSQKEELANQKSHEDRKEAKTDESQRVQDQTHKTTQRLATIKETLPESNGDFEDLKNKLSAFEQFLKNSMTSCKTDAEFEDCYPTLIYFIVSGSYCVINHLC